jgi:VanZ family protein
MSQIHDSQQVAGTMQRRPDGGSPRLWAAALPTLAGLAVLAQLYGLYRPGGPPQPELFPGVDKVEHLIGFAVPVALVLIAGWRYRARRGRAVSRRFVGTVLVLFSLHAVASELIQGAFYVWRKGDPLDVVADLAGIALGLGVFGLVRRRAPRRGTAAGRPEPAQP